MDARLEVMAVASSILIGLLIIATAITHYRGSEIKDDREHGRWSLWVEVSGLGLCVYLIWCFVGAIGAATTGKGELLIWTAVVALLSAIFLVYETVVLFRLLPGKAATAVRFNAYLGTALAVILWLLFVYRGVKIFNEGWHSQAVYTKGLANTMAMVLATALVCAFNLQFLAALLARALARSDRNGAEESEQEPQR